MLSARTEGKMLALAAAPQAAEQLPVERAYTPAILECWSRIGFHCFSMPIETYPWGGRSLHIARRIVVSNYIEPDDVVQAVFVHEQAKRTDPNWFAADPGMSYISALLRARSGNRWMQEMSDLAAKLPSVMGYMGQEWGEETRAMLAPERRARMHVVS